MPAPPSSPPAAAVQAAVQAHYDRHPYPDAARLSWPDTPDAAAATLRWTTRLALPAAPRIWVAGCGTVQAAEVALRHPTATVLATDLSAATLRQAQSVARVAGVAERITFRQEALGTAPAPPEGPFDLIDCIGVLHHLPEPAVGLAALAAALAPAGRIDLMVYQRDHRLPFNRLRDALRVLSAESAPTVEDAGWLATVVAESPTAPEDLQAAAAEMAGLAAHRPSYCADTLLRPHELGFTPRSVIDLARRAHLAFAGFAFPGEWTAGRYFDDPELLERLAALPRVDAAEALTLLLGREAPFLDLYLRAEGSPAPHTLTEDELLGGALRPHGPWRFLDLDPQTLAIRERGLWQPFPEDDGTLELTVRGRPLTVAASDVALAREVGRGLLVAEALDVWPEIAAVDDADDAEPAFFAAVRRLVDPDIGLLLFE